MLTTGRSAQRLSASEGKTDVLKTHPADSFGVLNAFRHQRGKQCVPLVAKRQITACSTPFGIRGENRSRNVDDARADELCSTPFGIRGENRRGTCLFWAEIDRAKRLSASEGKTVVVDADVWDDPEFVLNAFRHQRGKQSGRCIDPAT